MDCAIQALKQAAQIDSKERNALRRLLEKGHRWDDLAILLDQEAMDATDEEEQISLLKKLATLNEKKREDLVGAGDAWARLANLMPGDESPVLSAIKLYQKAERDDLAADVIAENVDTIETEEVRKTLLMQLGELREKSDDPSGAGEAFADAADLGQGDVAWEAAERCFKKAERWEDAARVVGEMASATGEAKKKAELRALEAEYLFQSDDADAAMVALEDAADLDPTNEQYAKALEERYLEQDRPEDFVDLLLRRASKIQDKEIRVALRKQAAGLQREQLEDLDGAPHTLMAI
jgi:tetratricopeptide (TPR) repeat protein